jgi:hypothetical protein
MDDAAIGTVVAQRTHDHRSCVGSHIFMGEDRYMATPTFPPHPEGRQCETCRMWMSQLKKEYVVRPEGLVQKAQWIAQGHPIVGQITTTSAFCWLLPTWTMMSRDQYCGQHEYAAGEPAAAERNVGIAEQPAVVERNVAEKPSAVQAR